MFKKDLKCLGAISLSLFWRVNKGRCWQSSVSSGKGQEGLRIHPFLQVDWAGLEAVQCQTNLPSIDLQLSQHLDTEVTLKLYFYHKTSGTPRKATTWLCPPCSGRFQPWPRSSWSFSHGFILTLTIAKHHTSSTEPARATITFIRNNVCVYVSRIFNKHYLLNPYSTSVNGISGRYYLNVRGRYSEP